MTTFIEKRGRTLIRNKYFTITAKCPTPGWPERFSCKIISWDEDTNEPFLVGVGYGPTRPESQKPARIDSHVNGYASLCVDEVRKREVAKLGVNVNVKDIL